MTSESPERYCSNQIICSSPRYPDDWEKKNRREKIDWLTSMISDSTKEETLRKLFDIVSSYHKDDVNRWKSYKYVKEHLTKEHGNQFTELFIRAI